MMSVVGRVRKMLAREGASGMARLLARHFAKLPRTACYHAGLYRLTRRSLPGLNLGSGNATIKGFCNIDASALSTCDVIAGVGSLKLSANSVATVYTSHVLEHFPRARAAAVLSEWRRVLRPGGTLYVCVPDVELLSRMYLDNLPRYRTLDGRHIVDTACSVMFGGQTSRYDFHYYGYSYATLAALLESVGFREVRRCDAAEQKCYHGLSAANAAIGGVPISLNVAAIK